MWSFEVDYVVVAQEMGQLEVSQFDKNHHTSPPPIYTFLKLHQNNVPKKFTIIVKIYNYENENKV